MKNLCLLPAKLFTLGILITLSIATAETGAATSAISIPAAIAKIRAAHVLKPETYLTLAFNEKQAVVRVNRPPEETDNDCKIDGVFVAKALVDAYPQSVTTVSVLFFKDQSQAIEIPVSATQLKDYAAGKIDKRALLDFIPINQVAPATTATVKAHTRGPNNLATNEELLERMAAYEARGMDMSAYRSQMAQMKGLFHSNDKKGAKTIRKQLTHELHLENP